MSSCITHSSCFQSVTSLWHVSSHHNIFTFGPSSTSHAKLRCSAKHDNTEHAHDESQSPSLLQLSTIAPTTRRSFVLTLASAAMLMGISGIQKVGAYSSPYRPGQSNDTTLPKRLYEKSEKEIVRTDSGIQYFDLKTGSGSEVSVGSVVSVNYTTRLRGLNGIKVQSSFDDPSGSPFVFRVGDPEVVPGVNEAIIGMREGGFRRVVVPPNLAYSSPDMKPAVTEFFARRRLLSVLRTNRDATIVFEYVLADIVSGNVFQSSNPSFLHVNDFHV